MVRNLCVVPATSDRWLSGLALDGVAGGKGKGASNSGSLDRKDSDSITCKLQDEIPQGSNRR